MTRPFSCAVLVFTFVACSKPQPSGSHQEPVPLTSSQQTTVAAPKVTLSPLVVGQLTELYKVGNEFTGAIRSGVTLQAFSAYAAKINGLTSSISKLLPAGESARFDRPFFRLSTALALTEEAWRVKVNRRSREETNSLHVTLLTHPELVSNLLMVGNRNPFGLQFTFTKIDQTGSLVDLQRLNDFAPVGPGLNSGQVGWVISFTALSGENVEEFGTLLMLCTRYYEAVEAEMLPHLKS